MSLEAGSFINDLDVTNPPGTDKRKQGDDHLRLIKTVLKGSFPSSSKAWYNPTTAAKTTNFTVVAADMNKTFLVDTSAGAVTMTLPTLASGDAGWECFMLKTTTDTNAVFIAPPSGTIQSGEYTGLAKCRRCIPGRKTRVMWTGTAFIAERVNNAPLGTLLEFSGSSLPVGFEWPNGQTLSSASTNYPEFYAANGSSGVVLDRRGRFGLGKDNMGGSTAGRVTVAGDNFDATVLGATQDQQNFTLAQANLPSVTLTTSIASGQGNHTHTIASAAQAGSNSNGGSGGNASNGVTITGTGASTLPAMTGTTPLGGSGTAKSKVPPTIVMNYILVVE